METRAGYVAVGAFVVVLLVTLIVGALWVARIQLSGQENLYDVYFTGSVTGLVDGSAVRYNGIPVGRITKIELDPLDPQRVRVTIEVNGETQIKSDVTAEISYQGLTGGAFIQLSGGSLQAKLLEARPGERYPVIPSKESTVQKIVNSAPEVLNKAMEVATHLDELLNEQNRKSVADTLQNVEHVTGALAAESDDIKKLIQDGSAAAVELRATIAEADKTVVELHSSVHEILGPGGDLRVTIKDIDGLTMRLADVTGHLDSMVQENRPPLHEFTQHGLTEVEELVTDARAMVAQLTRLGQSIERDPARFLYGDRRQGYQPK